MLGSPPRAAPRLRSWRRATGPMGTKRGIRKVRLEDARAARRVAGALFDSGPGRAAAQSVALLRHFRRRDRWPDPGIHAGRRDRSDRADAGRHIRIRRTRSFQIAALDAGRLFREHGMADRRRLRLFDRLSQERSWPQAGALAGARSRPTHAWPRLRRGAVRYRAGAGNALQYRAVRRHDLSDRQQHPAHLRLRARADRGQDRHLCDVDGVCHHGGDELAVPHGAGSERRGARYRQEDRQYRGQLVAMVHRLCPARHSAAAARSAAQLFHLPAGDQGEPGNRRVEQGRTRGDGAGVARRVDHGGACTAGDVPVDLRFQSEHQPARARQQFHQCHDGGVRDHLADAADRCDRLRRHRGGEGGVGGVFLLHLVADLVIGAERDRLHQVGGGGVCQTAVKPVADGGADSAGDVLLLGTLFLFPVSPRTRRRSFPWCWRSAKASPACRWTC